MNVLTEIRRHVGHALHVPWRTVRVTLEHRVRGWVLRVRCGNATMTMLHLAGPLASQYGHEKPLDGYLYGTSRTRGESIAWGLYLTRGYRTGRFRVFEHNAGRKR